MIRQSTLRPRSQSPDMILIQALRTLARAVQFKDQNHRLVNARGWERGEEEVASGTRGSFRGEKTMLQLARWK